MSKENTIILPVVDFCGIEVSRLILGANPFGGYSHQTAERNEEMLAYYTVERIVETWRRAESAGMNTFITNNETPHVLEAVWVYMAESGSLQWIAQVMARTKPDMLKAIDEAVEIGCKALYFHGGPIDDAYISKDEETLQTWCDHARSHGIPVGVAAHAPVAHA